MSFFSQLCFLYAVAFNKLVWHRIAFLLACALSCLIFDLRKFVQHVLRFGGKISHKGAKYPIGKFGFGLSQTVLCLTTRSTVYSKCSTGEIRMCYFDLDELVKVEETSADELVKVEETSSKAKELASASRTGPGPTAMVPRELKRARELSS